MVSQNDTIIDTAQLTHEDLIDAYEKLANAYRNTKIELDETTQQLHSQKQHRKVCENSLNDLQSELDQVNSIHEESLSQCDRKIEELKAKNLQLTMEKQSLENKIDETGAMIKDLKLEVENLKELLFEKTIKPRISNTYSKSLEEENEVLRNRNIEFEIQQQALNMKIDEFQSMIKRYEEKIKCMHENIDSKKMELEDKNEVIEHMQEKMHELSTELTTLRNSTIADEGSQCFIFVIISFIHSLIFFYYLLDRKGNSLFAEVDEQRQKMKKILQNERQHYLNMRKAYNSKEMEIRRLRRENLNIKAEIQSCSALLNRGESLAAQNMNLHLAQLEGEKKSLEAQVKEMEMRLIDMAREHNLGWIETMMISSTKDNRELKDKVFVLMREKTSVIDNCSKTMKDLGRIKLEVVKYKTLLGRIVDEFKLKIRPEKYFDIGISEEFLNNLKYDGTEMDDDIDAHEEVIEDEEMSECGILNESTIQLLGGRDKLGMALPDITKGSELSFKSIASSSRTDITIENFDTPLSSACDFTQTKSQETLNYITQSKSQGSSSKALQPIAQAKSNTKSPHANDTTKDESRLARKRAPIVVKRIVIPSKMPKKQDKLEL